MNSNNLKLFPVIGLKPIMKTVGFLCPGIYNISNSLEQRTGCISREGSRCPHLCGIQQGIDVGPIQPVQLTNYTGRCGWVFSCTWPHSFLAFKFKFYFNIQMLLSHILLTHKKTWMIKVLANIYVCVCVCFQFMGSLCVNCLTAWHVKSMQPSSVNLLYLLVFQYFMVIFQKTMNK